MLGGVAAVGIWEAADDRDAAPAAPGSPVGSAEAGSIAAVYRETVDAVVEVSARQAPTEEEDDDERPAPQPFPFGSPPDARASGSGFVIGERHVVTNQHVVGDAERAEVTLHDGSKLDARVVGVDASTDVALLEVEEVPDGVEPLELRSSRTLEIGDPVLAIGSPFGLQGTVTSGIVSGLDRTIEAPDGYAIDGVIQTDAALNRGNSGGPLLDGAGRVVGMNTQIASESGGNNGVGYAVPAETIRDVVEQLREDGEVRRAFLGVRIDDAEDGGARIASVSNGSPAARAGVRTGDVVTRAGEETVRAAADLRRAVTSREPGDELELELRRGGESRTVTVELGARPAASD